MFDGVNVNFSNSPLASSLVMEACENGFVLVLCICSIDSTKCFYPFVLFCLFEFFFFFNESPR